MGHFVRCTQLLGSALAVFVLKFVAGNVLRIILLVLLTGFFQDIAYVSISRHQVRVVQEFLEHELNVWLLLFQIMLKAVIKT